MIRACKRLEQRIRILSGKTGRNPMGDATAQHLAHTIKPQQQECDEGQIEQCFDAPRRQHAIINLHHMQRSDQHQQVGHARKQNQGFERR